MELRGRTNIAPLVLMAIIAALMALAVCTCPKVAFAANDNNLAAGQVASDDQGIIAKVNEQVAQRCSTLTTQGYSAPSTSNKYYYSGTYNPYYSAGLVGQCTWYAQGRASEILGRKYPQTTYTGDAKTWWDHVSGFSKDQTPRANSIACSSASTWGHVAIVESVGSNGSITVTEYYGSSKTFHTGTYANGSAWAKVSGCVFQGYIHLKDSTPTAKAPSISAPKSVLGGVDVTISDQEGGATITYNLDSGAKRTFTGSKTERLSKAYTWIAAYATKSGRLQSATSTKGVSLSTTATPKLEKTDMAGGATISLDSAGNGETIYYTTDGSEPSFNVATGQSVGTKYTAAFTLTENATVKAIAVRSGELVSGKLIQEVTVVPPKAPNGLTALVGSKTADKLAVDDAITIKWAEDKAAASYVATLYNEAGEMVETSTVKAAQAVFTPSKAGKYAVGVKAINVVGASEESGRIEFEAKNPCLVKFVDKVADEQGNVTTKVLDKQLVRYGYNAETPAVPVKRGYTFAGWDSDTPLTNITVDGYEIIANWQINIYTVRFYKEDGKTLIASQSVEFGKAATPPTPPAPEEGYVFTGWTVTEADDDSERSIDAVDSHMKVKAVYAWADQELPVVVSITNAKRNERVYTVDVNVKNNPTTATTAWLRVSLKTSAGKLVQSTKETISLPAAGATKNHTVTLKYEEGGYIATVAEVEVVGYSGDNRTGGAYSKAVQATVVSADDYTLATSASEWTEAKPAASDDYVIESEKQYRYQDKQTTTSTATSMDGWTRDGSSNTSYGSWGGNQTTTSKPTASDTLTITDQTTKYNLYHWHSKYDGIMNHDSCWVNNTSVKHTTTVTTLPPGPKYFFDDKGGKANQEYGPYGTCDWNPSKAYWWLESTVTTYTYKTRSKTVSYGYYRWGDWSDWSNEESVASGSRNVETRTVYRTRAKLFNDLTGTEDASGKTYTISGTFDSSLQAAGKEATVMVYNVTNSDPNEDQIQYIGQTTIDANGHYSFSFIPKKEPSVDTGDFIVSLGVKGSTGLVNVDKIDAPANEHKVIYLYKNAQGEDVTVAEQQVADGESAEVPDPPAVEGAQFQRWSASTTRVTNDMTVTALYTTATYAVAWVDWVNGGVFLETKAYGDELVAPVENPTANGYTFKGWDALLGGKTTVTGNTVINAVYDPEKYTVVFANARGGVLSMQQVAYGQAASLPTEIPTAEGMEFVAWDTSAGTPWWNVTEDMIVKPLFAYEGTTSSPFSKIEIADGYVSKKGAKAYLETATEGAKIYYTTDGSDPIAVEAGAKRSDLVSQGSDEGVEPAVITAKLYNDEEGITITEPTTIRAMAVMDGMNDSSISEIEVNVAATNNIANAEAGIVEAPFFYGEAVEPGIMVWLGDELLTYGEDYTVEYSDNAALGTGYATVTGVGDYMGTKVVEFDIVEAPQDGPGQSGDEPSSGDDPASGDEPTGDDPASGDKPSSGDKPAGSSEAATAGVAEGSVMFVAGASYKVASNDKATVVYQKAPKSKKVVTIPASVKINGKSYTVVGIAKNAFKGTKAKTVTVKTAKLSKKSVKGCFNGAKNLRTVKVKVGAKALNKKYAKKYKKIFAKKNAGKKVAVK